MAHIWNGRDELFESLGHQCSGNALVREFFSAKLGDGSLFEFWLDD